MALVWVFGLFFLNAAIGAAVYVWLDAPERFNGSLFAWYRDAKQIRYIGQLLQVLVLQAWPVALYMWRFGK